MPLTPNQIEIIGECLRAAAYGPFFPAGEFPALFGLELEEVAKVAEEWPVVVKAHANLRVAVNNSFNNLLGYPIKNKDRWDDYISIDRKELVKVYAAWRGKPTPDTPRGHFDRLM